MSDFNKDEYLNDLPDMDDLSGQAAPAAASAADGASADSAAGATQEGAAQPAAAQSQENGDSAAADGADKAGAADGKADDTLTPLGQAKKEAAEYLEALQRERAEFINFRNRAQKEQERFRQHGIIDVLTALLPALDDIDRIREHSEMDDSFKAVANKIDKAFEKFGVEKFAGSECREGNRRHRGGSWLPHRRPRDPRGPCGRGFSAELIAHSHNPRIRAKRM